MALIFSTAPPAPALTSGCGGGGPAYFTNFACVQSGSQTMTVSFDIAGGVSGVTYDILTSTNPAAVFSGSWVRLGSGQPCGTCVFSNQPAGGAFYILRVPTLLSAGPVYLTNSSFTLLVRQGNIAQCEIAGGLSNGLYDILISTNLNAPANTGWTWLAQGSPRHTFRFIHQPDAQAFFALGPPPPSMVVAWGNDSLGQCDVPPGLTNAVAVAGGIDFSLALRGDGTVLAWGDNSYGQTNLPPRLTNIVAIAAGPYHALALRADGTLAAWGDWWTGSSFPAVNLPAGLTNLTSIAAGADHDLALRADGSIVAWGASNAIFDTAPSNCPPAMAVAAGWYHNIALLTNAAVAGWGSNTMNLTNVPVDFTNTVAISATAVHTVAVHRDGTVEAWGDNSNGQTNVPLGLTNVVSVAAGQTYSLALKRDGTIALWGDFGAAGPAYVPYGLAGVVAIGPGANHCLAICSTRSTPIITAQPAAGQTVVATGSVTLMVKGQGLGNVAYQWQLNTTNIPGATNSTFTITNAQTVAQGSYRVVVSNAGGSITSSNSILTVAPLPLPQVTSWTSPADQWANSGSNVVLGLAVSNPPGVSAPVCQWQFNGTNLNSSTPGAYTYKISWLNHGQEGTYSATISNAAGTRGYSWKVNAAYPGSVALWGADDFGQADRPVGATSNVVAIAGGVSNSVALLANGSVIQWGCNWGAAPPGLTNAIAVSAGYSHALALRNDGTVVSWGLSSDPANIVPANLSSVRAIAAGWNHNLALLNNGTVSAWGVDGAGLGWHLTEVPAGLSNVTAVSAGSLHSVALRANGTVVAWGYSPQGETNVPAGLSTAVAIAAGGQHSLALKSDGTVVAWGFDGSGQCDVPAGLSNVIAIAAGWAHSVALKNDGTITAWGDDSEGQTAVATSLANVKSVAAGGRHTLAAMSSPLIPYQLDASRDLLLVYNTNSPDSRTVLNYYLQHRPLAATANVLGLGCTNSETILPADFTNEINLPVAEWLAANPTKRPGYVILFLGVPSRVGDPANDSVQPSVSYQIATGIANWRPLVTHLNMGDTNACMAYINKLAVMGSNYSPGRLVISAGGGAGYGGTNYVIDNARHGTGFPDDYTSFGWFGFDATNGLALNGVPSASVRYTNGLETMTNGLAQNLAHLTNAANVAGYMSWGAHSSLGSAYAINGELQWTGHSSWFIISTIESFNGDTNGSGCGNFIQWFSPNAFGGTNYQNTPVGAATHVEEPMVAGNESMQSYYGLWAAGQNFATCAWAARDTLYFMAVGDPLVCR